MQKAGAYLRSIREDKGYTIQEISKATKLSSSVIRALEEGRIDNVDPVYLKGFLKLYCRYLGLSWEVFISEHNIPALAKKQQKSFSTKPKAPAQRAAPAKGGFSFLKLISANSFGHKRPNYGPVANKKFIAMILTAVAVVLLAAIIFRGRVFILKKFPKIELPKVNQLKPEKQKAREPDKQAKPAPAKKSVVLAPAKVPVPAPVAKAVGAPLVGAQNTKPKEITLAIRAQEDSFITLKVDGKIVYQRMMYKGKAETWSAKTKIELSVGNAGGLSLEVNGKPLLPLGKKGQQIKNILINSEGLKVL